MSRFDIDKKAGTVYAMPAEHQMARSLPEHNQ